MIYVFMYRLTNDTGFAPCVDNNLLSLACCKGGQMRGEKVINTGLRHRIGVKRESDYSVDDVYVLGTYSNKFLYLAKITDVVTMEEYYSGVSKGRTDDIYDNVYGKLIRNKHLWKEKIHTEPDRIKKDLAGKYVLLSKKFIYLGKDAVYDDLIAKYNAKFHETKVYTGDRAQRIVETCEKYRDKNKHIPHEPFENKGGCR